MFEKALPSTAKLDLNTIYSGDKELAETGQTITEFVEHTLRDTQNPIQLLTLKSGEDLTTAHCIDTSEGTFIEEIRTYQPDGNADDVISQEFDICNGNYGPQNYPVIDVTTQQLSAQKCRSVTHIRYDKDWRRQYRLLGQGDSNAMLSELEKPNPLYSGKRLNYNLLREVMDGKGQSSLTMRELCRQLSGEIPIEIDLDETQSKGSQAPTIFYFNHYFENSVAIDTLMAGFAAYSVAASLSDNPFIIMADSDYGRKIDKVFPDTVVRLSSSITSPLKIVGNLLKGRSVVVASVGYPEFQLSYKDYLGSFPKFAALGRTVANKGRAINYVPISIFYADGKFQVKAGKKISHSELMGKNDTESSRLLMQPLASRLPQYMRGAFR